MLFVRMRERGEMGGRDGEMASFMGYLHRNIER